MSLTALYDLFTAFPALFYTFVIVFGLLVGSFLNVVIHRLPIINFRSSRKDCYEYFQEKYPEHLKSPKQELKHDEKFNLVVPRSACPKCGHNITALENIPIISYLFLRGKCRGCKTPISVRYPLVEALSALLVFIVAWRFGVTTPALYAIILTFALIALTFIDIDHYLLPDQITLSFLWFGLLVNVNGNFVSLESAVIGAAVGYFSLWLVFQIFFLITKREGMGYGDFKLLAMLGAWMGWQSLPAIILISSVIGSIVGITLIVTKQMNRTKPIPFGPYLAGAGWVFLIWGETINKTYLDLVL